MSVIHYGMCVFRSSRIPEPLEPFMAWRIATTIGALIPELPPVRSWRYCTELTTTRVLWP